MLRSSDWRRPFRRGRRLFCPLMGADKRYIEEEGGQGP